MAKPSLGLAGETPKKKSESVIHSQDEVRVVHQRLKRRASGNLSGCCWKRPIEIVLYLLKLVIFQFANCKRLPECMELSHPYDSWFSHEITNKSPCIPHLISIFHSSHGNFPWFSMVFTIQSPWSPRRRFGAHAHGTFHGANGAVQLVLLAQATGHLGVPWFRAFVRSKPPKDLEN